MRSIITAIACLLSIQCYSQAEATVSYNKIDNTFDFTIRNISENKEITIFDLSKSLADSSSKIYIEYSINDKEYYPKHLWWVGLEEMPGFITMKPLETRRYTYTAIKYPDETAYKYMKITYDIAYFYPDNSDPKIERCEGEKIFKINKEDYYTCTKRQWLF